MFHIRGKSRFSSFPQKKFHYIVQWMKNEDRMVSRYLPKTFMARALPNARFLLTTTYSITTADASIDWGNQCDQKKSPNVYKLLPKALKSCPKSNKSPNLVTLEARQVGRCRCRLWLNNMRRTKSVFGMAKNCDKKLSDSDGVIERESKVVFSWTDKDTLKHFLILPRGKYSTTAI